MKHKPIVVALCLVIFLLALHNLDTVPLPWFDEGWTLSLARNWVALGHYGHLLRGEPVPPTILNTGFPAIAPIATSFKLFGVSIWSGRWPIVLFLIGACLLTYHLAQRLYGPKVAVWSLAGLLLLPMYPDIHPIFMGRHALGEVPALFYLLAGYALLFANWRKNGWRALTAPLVLGLALQTKPQILPFFVLSLLIPACWLLWRRQSDGRYLFTALGLAIISSLALSYGANAILPSSAPADIAGDDPYAMTRDINVLTTYVIVLDPVFRLDALSTNLLVMTGFPVLLGLAYTGFAQLQLLRQKTITDVRLIWIFILWIFVLTYFCWFLFLSIGFHRYLFPPVMVGVIFATKAFYDLTFGFNLAKVLKTIAQGLRQRRQALRSVGLFLCVALLLIASGVSVMFLRMIFRPPPDTYADIILYLNNETEPTALIETYDSELFLLLGRDYNYPPDAVQHLLNQKVFLGRDVTVDYDPRPLGIDYLVTGSWSIWPLYDSLLSDNAFELTYQNRHYRVYRNTHRFFSP
jgi:4-amino-4-deoxy-L-arabinose transferase-like glycosyltransferase